MEKTPELQDLEHRVFILEKSFAVLAKTVLSTPELHEEFAANEDLFDAMEGLVFFLVAQKEWLKKQTKPSVVEQDIKRRAEELKGDVVDWSTERAPGPVVLSDYEDYQ